MRCADAGLARGPQLLPQDHGPHSARARGPSLRRHRNRPPLWRSDRNQDAGVGRNPRRLTQNWQDRAFAESWDARHLAGNPARAEHLVLLLAILEQVKPGWVLDLGCGSGLVAQMVLDKSADARVFGLDSSAAMLGIAKDRLGHYGDRVELAEGDLTSLDRVDAPTNCSAVIAVQSLHHLE